MTIKQIRKLTGLSQSKFAEAYGVPLRTLQGWEMGRPVPPFVLHLLERIVKIDIEEGRDYNEE